MMTTNILVRPT